MSRQVYGDEEKTVWVDHDGILYETTKAILFDIGGDKVWLPRSQIIDHGEEQVGITPWIAEQKGIKGDW